MIRSRKASNYKFIDKNLTLKQFKDLTLKQFKDFRLILFF